MITTCNCTCGGFLRSSKLTNASTASSSMLHRSTHGYSHTHTNSALHMGQEHYKAAPLRTHWSKYELPREKFAEVSCTFYQLQDSCQRRMKEWALILNKTSEKWSPHLCWPSPCPSASLSASPQPNHGGYMLLRKEVGVDGQGKRKGKMDVYM